MADITISRPDLFPDGTDVDVYDAADWPYGRPSGVPAGSAVDTETVSGGEAAFTGLTAGDYYAYAQVGGRDLYVFVQAGQDTPGHYTRIDEVDGLQAELDADDSAISALQSGLLAEAAARVTGDIPDLGAYFVTPGLANFSGVAATADRVYYSRIIIPTNATLIGVVCSNSSGAAGNVRSALYDDTGARVANRSTDFTVTSGANHVAFDSPYAAVTGIYFAAVVFSATPTMHFQLPAAPSGYTAGPGSGATAPSITAPTSIDSQRVATVGVYG